MIPTPAQVMPLFSTVAPAVYDAIDHGSGYADSLLPYSADPWYWSHSARYAIRNHLGAALAGEDDWTLAIGVPNSGVHLLLNLMHPVRLVRSINRDVPHPGRNRARQLAWSNEVLGLSHGNEQLPLMHLLIDWHLQDGQPMVHVSYPRGPWQYGAPTKVFWREPLLRGGSSVLDLSFVGDDGGDPLLTSVTIDASESGS